MLTDVIYLAHNRLEFTEASFLNMIRNTNWDLVRRLYVYDDCSTDGTKEFLFGELLNGINENKVVVEFIAGHRFGSPVEIMLDFIRRPDTCEFFAKIDNDTMLPKNWLWNCMSVLCNHPEIDLLGIEPAYSRTPHFKNGIQNPQVELVPKNIIAKNAAMHGYALCDSIGGIGLMRKRSFKDFPDMSSHSIYGGFTEWQIRHPEVTKGWIAPPIPVFLLDRMPIEPWVSLSKKYIENKEQRAWTGYDVNNPFWNWYVPTPSRLSLDNRIQ